jgi:hypothetical protein
MSNLVNQITDNRDNEIQTLDHEELKAVAGGLKLSDYAGCAGCGLLGFDPNFFDPRVNPAIDLRNVATRSF